MNVPLLLAALLARGLCGGGNQAPPPGRNAPAAKPAGAELRWLNLEEGLKILRKEYRPIALKYSVPRGDPARNASAEALEKVLKDPEVEKELQNFICVELSAEALEKPYPPDRAPPPAKAGAAPPPKGDQDPASPPPPTSARLRLVENVPALLIIDYRERVSRRFQEKIPAPGPLRKELAKTAREIRSLAVEARRVEKLLEESKYSHALGEPRQAVLTVLPLDDAKARRGLDQDLAARVEAVLAGYRREGQSLIATGETLESQKRYLEASEVYRRAARTYPFPEIVKTANRRQSDALRKERGGL
jgi:hypothetical protein